MTNLLLLWLKTRTSNEDISYILPNIYISNFKTSNNEELLKKYKITCIINITNTCSNNYYNRIDYNRFSLKDNKSEDQIKKLENILEYDIDGMHNKIIKGHNVLVHCHYGIQRACMYVSAYVMKYYNYNMLESIEFIKSKRPIAFRGGISFKKSLKKLEKKIMINKLNSNFKY